MRRFPDAHRALTTALLVAATLGAPFAAREVAGQELDAATRAEVIEALIGELSRSYVFPETASRMTADLQSISKDKHLRVRAGAAPLAPVARADGSAPVTPFGQTERLEGDVAYIEITTFALPPGQVRDVVRSTMSEAADARVLIIDVRSNGGGTPGLVALISSYLFDDEPVHLNSLYWRPADTTEDFYTDPSVGGTKYGASKPVWVLTSARTYSAAEEFTYNLQARERATIVGERTGGGAHPGGVIQLSHGLSVFVPSGRAINPITKTNWEGTGVTPDVSVSADEAIEAALRLVSTSKGH